MQVAQKDSPQKNNSNTWNIYCNIIVESMYIRNDLLSQA